MKRIDKHPSFDVESFTIFAVSGFICGYLLFSGRVPAPILHAFILLDSYIFTMLALWCVVEWVLPRLRTLWRSFQARARQEAKRAALSDLIAECVFEHSRVEHQGRDTAYLIYRDENQELYLLSPDDPEYIEVAQVLVRSAETYPVSPLPPDDESSGRSDDEGGMQETVNS